MLNHIPRPNRPNGDKIFRKITPSESEANIRLIFREENFIEMRKTQVHQISHLQTRHFVEDSTPVRQDKITQSGSKRNLTMIGVLFFAYSLLGKQKKRSRQRRNPLATPRKKQ
ncbi:hypothetical protein ACLSZ3_02650 [Avibacterium gallinarum]|uniref:hypothetical protein n=1 Tax=Avibacterium gallinarum TaxID=755 RepID=UPI0039FC8C6A